MTRHEIDAYVAQNGAPSNSYHGNDSFSERMHFFFENGKWRVYDRERGIKFNEQMFANEETARKQVVAMLLRTSGTGLNFASPVA